MFIPGKNVKERTPSETERSYKCAWNNSTAELAREIHEARAQTLERVTQR